MNSQEQKKAAYIWPKPAVDKDGVKYVPIIRRCVRAEVVGDAAPGLAIIKEGALKQFNTMQSTGYLKMLVINFLIHCTNIFEGGHDTNLQCNSSPTKVSTDPNSLVPIRAHPES